MKLRGGRINETRGLMSIGSKEEGPLGRSFKYEDKLRKISFSGLMESFT